VYVFGPDQGADFASGLFVAASALGKSAVPTSRTFWPGKNFSVAGFGVVSVWINMGANLFCQDLHMLFAPG